MAENIFEIENIPRMAMVITKTIQGLDVPYIREDISETGVDKDELANIFSSIMLNGLKKREN